jgi:hypothetical protein
MLFARFPGRELFSHHTISEDTMRFPHTLLCLVLLCLSGCSSLEPQIGPQTLYRDLDVHRPPLSIAEAPERPSSTPLTATVHPFALLQEVHDPAAVETAVTRLLVRRWSGDRVFLRTSFSGSTGQQPNEIDQPPDLIVTGTIPYLLVSGAKGTTVVALHLEIHDARTGELLWSMDHAGSIEAGLDQDYILVQTRPRPPLDPVAKILDVLARDMGEPLRSWSWAGAHPPPAETPYRVEARPWWRSFGSGPAGER